MISNITKLVKDLCPGDIFGWNNFYDRSTPKIRALCLWNKIASEEANTRSIGGLILYRQKRRKYDYDYSKLKISTWVSNAKIDVYLDSENL